MAPRTVRGATCAILLVLLIVINASQVAHAQVREFNVPAQAATTGITEFARQAAIQILVSESLVRGKRTAEVMGTHSVEQALAMLLTGTGLTATSRDGVSYALAPAPAH